MRIRIDCPYCKKVDVMDIPSCEVQPEGEDPKVELPHDEDTEDLEKFREGSEDGSDE